MTQTGRSDSATETELLNAARAALDALPETARAELLVHALSIDSWTPHISLRIIAGVEAPGSASFLLKGVSRDADDRLVQSEREGRPAGSQPSADDDAYATIPLTTPALVAQRDAIVHKLDEKARRLRARRGADRSA